MTLVVNPISLDSLSNPNIEQLVIQFVSLCLQKTWREDSHLMLKNTLDQLISKNNKVIPTIATDQVI